MEPREKKRKSADSRSSSSSSTSAGVLQSAFFYPFTNTKWSNDMNKRESSSSQSEGQRGQKKSGSAVKETSSKKSEIVEAAGSSAAAAANNSKPASEPAISKSDMENASLEKLLAEKSRQLHSTQLKLTWCKAEVSNKDQELQRHKASMAMLKNLFEKNKLTLETQVEAQKEVIAEQMRQLQELTESVQSGERALKALAEEKATLLELNKTISSDLFLKDQQIEKLKAKVLQLEDNESQQLQLQEYEAWKEQQALEELLLSEFRRLSHIQEEEAAPDKVSPAAVSQKKKKNKGHATGHPPRPQQAQNRSETDDVGTQVPEAGDEEPAVVQPHQGPLPEEDTLEDIEEMARNPLEKPPLIPTLLSPLTETPTHYTLICQLSDTLVAVVKAFEQETDYLKRIIQTNNYIS